MPVGQSDVQFYTYDGNDLVYRQFIGTETTAMDGSDFSGDNGVLYLYGPTGLTMEFDRFGNYRTLLFDPQGSNVSSVEALPYYGGNITGTTWFPQFYDGYGEPVWAATASTAPLILNRATAQPFQYKGQYGYLTDGATGLDYCINRYYDPLSGRWTSRDPSGLDGGVNVYQYCMADPILGVDADGLDALIVYGGDWRAMDVTWRDLANNYAKDYEACTGNHAHVSFIKNIDTFNAALRKTKNIDTLLYVGHSGPGILYLRSPVHPHSNDITSKEDSGLFAGNVEPGALIFLFGCGTAAGRGQKRVGEFSGPFLPNGTPTTAEAFAKQFHTDVWGFEPHVTLGPTYVTPDAFGPTYAPGWKFRTSGTQYFHNGVIPVFPVRVRH